MYRSLTLMVALGVLFSPDMSGAGAAADDPVVGDEAPGFDLTGSDGQRHRLEDYRGRPVVLAWFPKAFTGG